MWSGLLILLALAPVHTSVVEGGSGPGGVIIAQVTGQTEGGVAHPRSRRTGKPVVTCPPFERVTGVTVAGAAGAAEPTKVINGVLHHLFVRVCEGESQYAWVPELTTKELATGAFSEVVKRVPKPRLVSAPPVGKLIVNLETWFGVARMGPVSATAAIPGLSVTVTATPRRIVLTTGSRASGDPSTVTCTLWGSATKPANGCVWTPSVPSVPRFTGGGYVFRGSVAVWWDVSWRGSDGSSGVLDPMSVSTPVRFAVREIQTIGGTP